MAPPRKRNRLVQRNPMGVPDASASVERGIATGDVYARDPTQEESGFVDPSFSMPGSGLSFGMGIDESTGQRIDPKAAARQAAIDAGIASAPADSTSTPVATTPLPTSSGSGLTFLGTDDPDVEHYDEGGNLISEADYNAILAEGNHDEEITEEWM